jgi:5-methylcytosine-specific restriction endonuclease McrA
VGSVIKGVDTLSIPSNQSTVVAVVLLAVVLGATLCLVLLAVRRRRLVFEASVALKHLTDLNFRFQSSVTRREPIKVEWKSQANSKSKYDRFDLSASMERGVLEYEQWFKQELWLRVEATQQFSLYRADADALAVGWLGRSTHPRVSEKHFVAIEKKAFGRRRLLYPVPLAKISSAVSYVSPKGRNAYSRHLEWDFAQLQNGLRRALEIRANQSTQQYLRQRERSLMTPSLRVAILRRDSSRCRMCGASAAAGATLHIDHIVPVSLGGQTVPENLQTLCDSCNYGKSNKFVG